MKTLSTALYRVLGITSCLLACTACSKSTIWSAVSKSTASEVKRDLEFDSENHLSADIYYTDKKYSRNGKTTVTPPTVIFIYGGSWKQGDKGEYAFVADGLVKSGFNVVIPNYRLYPKAAYPEFIKDLETFSHWYHSHASELGLSSREIHLMAHSAGAYNAAMFILDPQYKKPFNFSSFIGLAGPYDFFLPTEDPNYRPIFTEKGNFNTRDQLPVTQPDHNLAQTVPRVLLLHGEKDQLVSPKNIESFEGYLKKAGVTVTSKIYSNVNHANLIAAVNNIPLVNKVPAINGKINEDILMFLRQ